MIFLAFSAFAEAAVLYVGRYKLQSLQDSCICSDIDSNLSQIVTTILSLGYLLFRSARMILAS
jgi:hypothetical protein